METVIKRIDIVLLDTNENIGELSELLCERELEISEPLFMNELARVVYREHSKKQPRRPNTDTGTPIFGKFGLAWALLSDLPRDLAGGGFRLGWICRQQQTPFNRITDVIVASRQGRQARLGASKKRRSRKQKHVNDGKLRFSFLPTETIGEAGSVVMSEMLMAHLEAHLAENCHVWLNPDTSVTVNVNLRNTLDVPRRINELVFDTEKGFRSFNVPNPHRRIG